MISGERAKMLARQIGVSEQVIDEICDDNVCGGGNNNHNSNFDCDSLVSFEDFEIFYFEMFSRI